MRSHLTLPLGLLDNLPDPIILIDHNRELLAANRKAKDTFTIEDRNLGRDLALSLRHPEILGAADLVLAGETRRSGEITLPVPIRRTFVVDVIAMSDDTTPELAAVIILNDITSAHRAEEMRADFVANVSHELRSPLAALVGFIETLKGPARDDKAAQERFLNIMQREADRMARIINDLLSLSQVEVNEHISPTTPVNLTILIGHVVDLLSIKASEKGMNIQTSAPGDIPLIPGDEDQLTQVFHNLVDNAIKYGQKGTAIKISFDHVDRVPGTKRAGVAVSITDQGQGIAPELVPRLTERFYRVDKARSRDMGGTGLGLAIVKHIISRHRGRLKVDSQVNVGSTFTVMLPLGGETA